MAQQCSEAIAQFVLKVSDWVLLGIKILHPRKLHSENSESTLKSQVYSKEPERSHGKASIPEDLCVLGMMLKLTALKREFAVGKGVVSPQIHFMPERSCTLQKFQENIMV